MKNDFQNSSFEDNALIKAAMDGHIWTIKELMKQKKIIKSLINSCDQEKRTPLIWASWMGYKEIVSLLLKCPDIDLNKKDIYSQTALDICSKINTSAHRKIVKLIMEHYERIRPSKRIDKNPS